MRLRQVRELAPEEAIASNEGWAAHRRATVDVPLAEPADVDWADVVLFGSPTRFGNVAAQLKQFLDTLGPQWARGTLADKVYAGFVSTGTAHGGQESTLLALYQSIHHFGGIIASPGYTDPIQYVAGNPYGASHISANGQNPPGETELRAASYLAQRAVRIGRALKAGLAQTA